MVPPDSEKDFQLATLFDSETRPNTAAMQTALLDGGSQVPSWGTRRNLDEHLATLVSEFSGQSVLLLYHAGLIVHLRRKIDPSVNLQKFNRLWRQHNEFLLKSLSSRWLKSALDTIADYSPNPTERAAALAGIMFINTIKMYETERIATGSQPVDYAPIEGRVPLFDGLSAFVIGRGDMIKNMIERATRPFEPQFIAPKIMRELLNRAMSHDTVFRRFASVHKNERTRW